MRFSQRDAATVTSAGRQNASLKVRLLCVTRWSRTKFDGPTTTSIEQGTRHSDGRCVQSGGATTQTGEEVQAIVVAYAQAPADTKSSPDAPRTEVGVAAGYLDRDGPSVGRG